MLNANCAVQMSEAARRVSWQTDYVNGGVGQIVEAHRVSEAMTDETDIVYTYAVRWQDDIVYAYDDVWLENVCR